MQMRSEHAAMGLRRIGHIAWLLWGVVLLAWSLPAPAFDTGHHSDLSREVLQEQGFGDTAIKVAQVQNWLVDYFSTSPTSKIKGQVEQLHCDNLFSTQQVRNYWGHLTVNTRNAIQQAAREGDTLKALTLLGISLHTVQDFYAHSNWVETHPAADDSFRTETWFSAPPAESSANLYTGAYPKMRPGASELHGDYDRGLNKDSYARPHWDSAYVFAYAGSRQWLAAVQKWAEEIDPQFWQRVKTFSVQEGDRKALDFDLEAAYHISEWIAVAGQDGHWKGKGSGSNADFIPFAARWTASPDSRFVREFKNRAVHRLISDGLTGDSPPAMPVADVPRIAHNRKAIILRTLHVEEKEDLGVFEPRIDSPGGKADFYARITIAGQPFIEAMRTDARRVSPAWMTIKFVPASTPEVAIKYELWDEDGGIAGKDDHCDINPAKGMRDLDFTFALDSRSCSGDVNGVHDKAENAVSISGAKPDKDRAAVQFYIYRRSLSE